VEKSTELIDAAITHALETMSPLTCDGWVFTQPVVLVGSALHGWYLDGVEFLDSVNLSRSSVEDTTFIRCIFHKSADLRGLRVGPQAGFRECTFDADVAFDWLISTADVLFTSITFRRRASFGHSIFQSPVRFSNVTFERGGDFHDVRFAPRSAFEDIFAAEPLEFAHAEVDEVIFRCRLERALLAGAYGVARAEFDAASWNDVPDKTVSRVLPAWLRLWPVDGYVVWEELVARESEDAAAFATAAQMYAVLRRAHARRGIHEAANLFRLGELDMRRLAAHARGGAARGMCFEDLYAVIGGYGVRPQRPLVWLGILLLVLAPLGYGLAGVTIGSERYYATLDFEEMSLGAFFALFGLALRTASLLGDPVGVHLGVAGELVQAGTRLVAPALALFISLGVRNRFRT
jgi:hypothetical protein